MDLAAENRTYLEDQQISILAALNSEPQALNSKP